MDTTSTTVDALAAGLDQPKSRLTALRASVEFGILVAALLAIMWVLPILRAPPAAGRGMAGAILVFLVVCQLNERPHRRKLGLRFDNFPRALRELAVPVG